MQVPLNEPVSWPAARIRRALWCAQLALAGLVVLAAAAVGAIVEQPDVGAPPPAVVLIETTASPPASGVADVALAPSSEGALPTLATLLVGWTLTVVVGTVGRRRLEDRESARWDAEWARVEPEWSGRVP